MYSIVIMAVQWSGSPQAGNIFPGVFVRLDVRQRLREVSGLLVSHRWVVGVGAGDKGELKIQKN